jgi:hypothetical protein
VRSQVLEGHRRQCRLASAGLLPQPSTMPAATAAAAATTARFKPSATTTGPLVRASQRLVLCQTDCPPFAARAAVTAGYCTSAFYNSPLVGVSIGKDASTTDTICHAGSALRNGASLTNTANIALAEQCDTSAGVMPSTCGGLVRLGQSLGLNDRAWPHFALTSRRMLVLSSGRPSAVLQPTCARQRSCSDRGGGG